MNRRLLRDFNCGPVDLLQDSVIKLKLYIPRVIYIYIYTINGIIEQRATLKFCEIERSQYVKTQRARLGSTIGLVRVIGLK